MPRRQEPCILDAVLDQLLAGADPKTAFDANELIDDLKLAERVHSPNVWFHIGPQIPPREGTRPTVL